MDFGSFLRKKQAISGRTDAHHSLDYTETYEQYENTGGDQAHYESYHQYPESDYNQEYVSYEQSCHQEDEAYENQYDFDEGADAHNDQYVERSQQSVFPREVNQSVFPKDVENEEEEDNEEENDVDDETNEAINKLPERHNRGLMSTLIGLAGPEVQNRPLDPLPPPQPMKLEDDEMKYLGKKMSASESMKTEDFLNAGISKDLIAQADLDPEIGKADLKPEDIGKTTEKREFFCKLCNTQTTSLGNFKDHLNGKSHKATFEAFKIGKKPSTNSKTKGKNKSTLPTELLGKSSVVESLLTEAVEPILGLSFVTEYHSSNNVQCVCNLCGVKFDRNIALSHTTGVKHRLHYMKEKRPSTYIHLKKFGGKKSQLAAFLDELSLDAEKEDGRGTPTIKVYETIEEDETHTELEECFSDEDTGLSIEQKKIQALEKRREKKGVTLTFDEWVNTEAKKSKEAHDNSKRSRSISPGDEEVDPNVFKFGQGKLNAPSTSLGKKDKLLPVYDRRGPPPDKLRPGPPSKKYGAPFEHFGPRGPNRGRFRPHLDRSGHPLRRHGPPPHEDFGPPNRYGPPPHDRYGPPPHDRYGPPPYDRYGSPPHRRESPPFDRHDNRGTPPRDRYGPPPHDYYGPPNDLRGATSQERYGPPHNRHGPPIDHRGSPHRDRFGLPNDRHGPPPHDRYGPPPHDRYGPPPHDRYGPPPHGRYGPPIDRHDPHSIPPSYGRPRSDDYLDPDPTKRILKSDRRKLSQDRDSVVIDYSHGADNERAKKRAAWEDDIQNILGPSARSSRDPDGLALLSSSYRRESQSPPRSKAVKSRSPSHSKVPFKQLPFAKSYLEKLPQRREKNRHRRSSSSSSSSSRSRSRSSSRGSHRRRRKSREKGRRSRSPMGRYGSPRRKPSPSQSRKHTYKRSRSPSLSKLYGQSSPRRRDRWSESHRNKSPEPESSRRKKSKNADEADAEKIANMLLSVTSQMVKNVNSPSDLEAIISRNLTSTLAQLKKPQSSENREKERSSSPERAPVKKSKIRDPPRNKGDNDRELASQSMNPNPLHPVVYQAPPLRYNPNQPPLPQQAPPRLYNPPPPLPPPPPQLPYSYMNHPPPPLPLQKTWPRPSAPTKQNVKKKQPRERVIFTLGGRGTGGLQQSALSKFQDDDS